LARSDAFEFWKGQATTIRDFWRLYGGTRALIKSPHLTIAVALTAISIYFWSGATKAADIAISTLPNLLGFTVGALAIVLAFSSAKIFKTIAEQGEPLSFFMKLIASLVHFIMVQVIALVCAIFAKITNMRAFDILSLLLLYYAVLITFSATIHLFLTAQIYNAHASLDDED
jgi:hypothetical protein